MADEPAVLLVEPRHAMAQFLTEQLTLDRLTTVLARSAPDALAPKGPRPPRLMLVGDLAQRRDVLDLIASVRAGYATNVDPVLPILHLSDRTGELDVLRAFEAGADDVVPRPFSYPVLRARIVAQMRRSNQPRDRPPLRVGSLELDTCARHVTMNGETVILTRLEYDLLVHLAAAPERVFDKRDLLREVWGFDPGGFTRAVDSAAIRLRRKLGPEWVANEWGVGYRLLPRGSCAVAAQGRAAASA